MLYLVSLGLWDHKDISLRGLEALKKCKKIYFEKYTTATICKAKNIETLLGKKVREVDRKFVEERFPLEEAKNNDIALVVGGDALVATTHSELLLEAKKKDIEVKVIHGSSILTAVGETGLQIYKFGRVSSIPFWQKNFEPTSFYDVVHTNLKNRMHSLLLLDIEMNIKQGLEILEKAEKKMKKGIIKNKTKLIVCISLGADNQKIIYGEIRKLKNLEFPYVPSVIIIPTVLHFKEQEFLDLFKI